ncbi:MAG: 30S ribosome-binding factor RbfA [Hahellaceae bacterium]|nr:30S ribosome-binding factor RbfA [Hahellaceae bacterium]MCP5168764.1 30S ribosome-binding factor RbfA [Hahellaceae bacterium]
MPREFSRLDRIADQMQRELANLVRNSMKDPRLGMVTINGVRVAKDLGYADVYITLLSVDEVFESSPEVKETLAVLNHAAGFLRSELGRLMMLRVIPRLRFHFDSSVGYGRHMSYLIREAREKDQEDAQSRGDVSEESGTPEE